MATAQPFTWGRGGARLTPEELAKQRQVEAALQARGTDTSPVGHWTQGLARVADAMAGSFRRGGLDRASEANAAENEEMLASLTGGGPPQPEPAAVSPISAPDVAPQPADDLVQRVIQQESAGNPNAVSPKGAMGLMQVMPATARDPGFGVKPMDPAKAFDPAENQRFGTEYLNAMKTRYGGDTDAALVAYNAGPGTADKWIAGGRNSATLPAETRDYVAKINGSGQRPVQTAQAGGGIDPNVMKALSSPYASPQVKAVAKMMYEQQIQQNDPKTKLEIQKLQRELNAPPERKTAVINGRLVDTQNGQQIAQFDDPVKPTGDMQEYNFAKEQGFTGSFVDFQLAQKKAGASSTNVNVGAGDKFYEELDKKNAATFSSLSEGGMQARGKLAQIDRLEGLMAGAQAGGFARLKQAAGEYGINTEGLDDIQAAQALINKMVPEQRPAGSGPMSDRDIELFRASLPRVINQPGGNKMITDTLRGVAQYEMQMGEIADQVADRTMTPVEARKAMRELKNPLADFGKAAKAEGVPEGVDAKVWEHMPAEDRALWK